MKQQEIVRFVKTCFREGRTPPHSGDTPPLWALDGAKYYVDLVIDYFKLEPDANLIKDVTCAVAQNWDLPGAMNERFVNLIQDYDVNFTPSLPFALNYLKATLGPEWNKPFVNLWRATGKNQQDTARCLVGVNIKHGKMWWYAWEETYSSQGKFEQLTLFGDGK